MADPDSNDDSGRHGPIEREPGPVEKRLRESEERKGLTGSGAPHPGGEPAPPERPPIWKEESRARDE